MAGPAPPLVLRAKYLPSPKGQGIPGILHMTESRFTWTPNDPTVASKLDVDFKEIVAQRSSKETPKSKKALLNLGKDADMKDGFIFDFESFQDRDKGRDHVAKILAKLRPNGAGSGQGGVSAKPAAVSPQDSLFPSQMEQRMKLLQKDSELRELHQKLVMTNILSEAEFWDGRKNLIEGERQRTGLKSEMLADVRPQPDGRTNKVTFNLTPEIIHQIFAEKPAVHRAFLANVPNKLSELEFWTKYCRAEYLFRTRNAATAAAETADDEDLAVFARDDDIIAAQARRKIKMVDPTLDMAADLADDYTSLPGHGILRDGDKKELIIENEATRKRTILHDINRHAAVVLEGRPVDVELKDTTTVALALSKAQQEMVSRDPAADDSRRPQRAHDITEMDDLQGPQTAALVPLRIQDPRKYFDSQPAVGAGNVATPMELDSTTVFDSFRQQIAAMRDIDSSSSAPIPPDVALKVLKEVTQQISTNKLQQGKTAEKNVLDSIPRHLKDELFQHSATANELLRHFWACYPLTTAFLVNKANRLKDAMADLYSRLEATKVSAPASCRHQLSQLVYPITQQLDTGFSHHEADAQRRASKSSDRSGGLRRAQ